MKPSRIYEKTSYLIVGVLNTLAYYLSIYYLYVVFNFNEYFSIFLAYVIALTTAISLNLLFTFKNYKKSASMIIKYIKVVITVFLLNILVTKFCFIFVSKRFILIQVIFSGAFFLLNYFLIKKRVFQ